MSHRDAIAAVALMYCFALSGCVTSTEAKFEAARRRVYRAPFDRHPAVIAQLEREGRITSETRREWTALWLKLKQQMEVEQIAQARERQRLWNSLTPAERIQLQLQAQALSAQPSYYTQPIPDRIDVYHHRDPNPPRQGFQPRILQPNGGSTMLDTFRAVRGY